jgi:hypothetical protein
MKLHETLTQALARRLSITTKHRRTKLKKMSFADGVQNAAARKRAQKMKFGLRDKYGAYTLTGNRTATDGGKIRRVWLGGISAQRGY